MLVLDRVWKEIRDNFTREEINALRRAITRELMCPQAWEIDPEVLEPALADKLSNHLLAANRTR